MIIIIEDNISLVNSVIDHKIFVYCLLLVDLQTSKPKAYAWRDLAGDSFTCKASGSYVLRLSSRLCNRQLAMLLIKNVSDTNSKNDNIL